MARIDVENLLIALSYPEEQTGIEKELILLFYQKLKYYIRSLKRLEKISNITNYNENYFINRSNAVEQFGKDVDRAFTTLTAINGRFRKRTGNYVIIGTVGKSKNQATKGEWISYRPEKKKILDQIISDLSRLQSNARSA